MKFKLNHSELTALHTMLEGPALNIKPSGTFDKLGIALIAQIWDKLDRKMAGVERKTKYTLSLSKAEAIGFYLYWHSVGVPYNMFYEANVIRTIQDSIHQQYIN